MSPLLRLVIGLLAAARVFLRLARGSRVGVRGGGALFG